MQDNKILLAGLLCVAIVLTGCGNKDDEASLEDRMLEGGVVEGALDAAPVEDPVAQYEDAISPEAIVDGLNAGDTPSPFDENPAPAPELSPEEKDEAAQKAVEAKECTDGGGLYNSSLRECFDGGSDESAALRGEGQQLEILDTDDKETVERKTCINNKGTYNSQQGECFTK